MLISRVSALNYNSNVNNSFSGKKPPVLDISYFTAKKSLSSEEINSLFKKVCDFMQENNQSIDKGWDSFAKAFELIPDLYKLCTISMTRLLTNFQATNWTAAGRTSLPQPNRWGLF